MRGIQKNVRLFLAHRLRHLRAVRASGDLRKMMDAVRSDLIRNLAQMTNR